MKINATGSVLALVASLVAAIASVFVIVGVGSLFFSPIVFVAAILAVVFLVSDRVPLFHRRGGSLGRRETAELFRLFIEHSPVFTFLKDDKLRLLLLSSNYETILGKSIDGAIGKRSDALYEPEYAARLDERDRTILREGKPRESESEDGGRFFRTLEFPIFRRGRPAYLAGFTFDVTEQKRAEADALQSLREKDTLIRELYHRTKNTLQVIRSMLELQLEKYPRSESAQRLVKDAEDRIQAISLVHQMLFESRDLSRIRIQDYVSELTALIYRSFGVSQERIALEIDVEAQSFALDIAIPLGLILNELMTNSLKHGFPDRRSGTIRIGMIRQDDRCCVLSYSDDGVGVPAGFDFLGGNTLGLKLIRSIGAQINGEVRFGADGGVSCSIVFSAAEERPRVRSQEEAVEACEPGNIAQAFIQPRGTLESR